MITRTDGVYGVRRAGMALALLWIASGMAVAADRPNKAQTNAAAEFLAAVSTGDPQAIALTLHPTELDALRSRILTQLHDEAKRNDNTIRARLFGPGMPLADLERMTRVGFYTVLARKLYLSSREFRDVDGLAAIPDRDGAVLVVVRGKPPREGGTISVPEVVAVKPYGKDWKAIVPPEIEAQIDDLIHARQGVAAGRPRPVPAAVPAAAAGGAPSTTPTESGVPPAITELLAGAEKALTEGKCEEYYGKDMSPNFRRVTAKKAREALVSGCERSSSTRDMLASTVRIVRGLVPKFEYEGQRAVYDLSGQGLPFDRFVLEQVDKHWYIAE